MLKEGILLGERYVILAHIGSGGMADVYKAKDREQDRFVAIKVLRREYYENDTFVKKFVAEAEATANISHPNIVDIYDAEYRDGIHYIVMELAEGMTLKQYIRRYGRLSARETVDIAIQIAEALKTAHSHGISHRDIKPQNIIVSDSGRAKVTDFGIAKVATMDTISSNAMGSVHYISPEQARGGFSDARSDIYSLGITIYEMATGRVPFDGENSVAIALMHIREEITPPRCYFPDIPASLENIILKCTMKSPEQRYNNAAALISDLERVFESPDGDYVYTDLMVDDSPTVKRDGQELEQIRESLRRGRTLTIEDRPGSGQDEFNDEGGPRRAMPLNEEEENQKDLEEEAEDGEEDHSRLEKLVIAVTVLMGIAIAGTAIYSLGNAFHLFTGGDITTSINTEATSQALLASTQASYVELPSFLDMNRNEAETKVTSLGLRCSFVYDKDVNSSVEDLIVVAQDYDEGEEVQTGTRITLTLGLAESISDSLEVPALVNQTEEEAASTLEAMGLGVMKTYATSDTVKQGYVIRQSPVGGSVVNKGFTVTITISKGLEQVRVPTLTGQSQKNAERELNRVGLILGNITSDYSGEVGVGDVISQDIAAGTMVDKGTAVSIVISLGEQERYHYEATLMLDSGPFEEGQSGYVELVLEQGDSKTTVFSKSNVTNDDFPMNLTFDGTQEGSGTVIMYVNGEEYASYPVMIQAIAD